MMMMMMCFVILVHPSFATTKTDPLAFTAFTSFPNFTIARLSARPLARQSARPLDQPTIQRNVRPTGHEPARRAEQWRAELAAAD